MRVAREKRREVETLFIPGENWDDVEGTDIGLPGRNELGGDRRVSGVLADDVEVLGAIEAGAIRDDPEHFERAGDG